MKTQDDSISFSLSIFRVCFFPLSLTVVSALNDVGWTVFLLPIWRTLGSLIWHFPLFIIRRWNLFVTGQSLKHPFPAVTRHWTQGTPSSRTHSTLQKPIKNLYYVSGKKTKHLF